MDSGRQAETAASEKCIGRWIAERKCRNKVFLSTKGAHPELADIHSSRMSRENIVQDLNESLAFLQCDYVDLYFLHRDDTTKPVSFIMDVLDEQVKAGKIRFLGASNWTKSRIDEANAYAVANGKTPFSVSQIQWSLADVKPDAGLDDTLVQMNKSEYDAYLKNPLPVMAFSSQARGFFPKVFNGRRADRRSFETGLLLRKKYYALSACGRTGRQQTGSCKRGGAGGHYL